MKYFYKILRLFLCPHKYVEINRYQKTQTYTSGARIECMEYHTKCKYCGKFKEYTL